MCFHSSNTVRCLLHLRQTRACAHISISQLFMATVGFVFAPLAPLVAVAACVVFWVSAVVYKYQLMFVFVTKVETGGVSVPFQSQSHPQPRQYLTRHLPHLQRLWNVIMNRLLFSVVLMQLLMVLSTSAFFHLRSTQCLTHCLAFPHCFLLLEQQQQPASSLASSRCTGSRPCPRS